MSKTMDGRATVCRGECQVVDVYYADRWVPGSLLGWRHDAGGACRFFVRFTAGSRETTAWAELEQVRLPEASPLGPSASGRDDFGSAGPSTVALDLPRTQPRPSGRAQHSWFVARADLVRHEVDLVTRRGSRHGASPAVGRHRAADSGVGRLA